MLKPGRELQRKKQYYIREFTNLLAHEQRFPLSRESSDTLKDLQNVLELGEKDVEQIHKFEVLKLCNDKLTEVVEQNKKRTTTAV